MNVFTKIISGFAGLLASHIGSSQSIDLQSYSNESTKLQRKAMYTLAGWAGANIITGTYLTSHASGSAAYFHRMNAYWNIVNGTLATVALVRLHKKKPDQSFADLYKQQQNMERIFLLNAGLDVAYVAAGIYLNEKSKNDKANTNKWKGFGNSVVLQGGFLLVFDGVMYTLMHSKGKRLERVLEKIQLSSNGSGISLLVNL